MNSEENTQLHGYKLILARTVWIVIAVLAIVPIVISIPQSYAQYLNVCTQASCPNQQATPDTVRALHSVGLSLQFYALYLTTLEIVFMLVFLAIPTIIALRKSHDWMGLLVSLTLIIIGTGVFTNYQILANVYPPLTQILADFMQFLFIALILLSAYLFPNGHFIPRWTRWLVLLVVIILLGSAFLPNTLLNTDNWPDPFRTVVQFGVFVTALFAQVYRYFWISTPVQRQQTKWIVFGIMATIIYFIALQIFSTLNPALTEANSLGVLFAEASYLLALIIVPLSIAFSILRYRLWDIDLLIKRTLVYTTLTAILALLYFGCVVLLQHLVNGLTGQVGQTPLIIVASTLAIAALFHPLRRRIQKIIDRRFYRRKYDAAKTLEAFSATLRNEVDLNTLREHLLTVVQETMQPAHVSLWLRSPAHQKVSWSATSAVPSEDEARGEK
jgi:hypothetical protein